MGLRKGQKELVEQYRGGYCAIPAIPGGGKTHCLSLWAVEMIARGLHRPGKILIVTYMNSAVNNFKQRIAEELQKRGITGGKDYFVSTIHGLCLQIIKEKPDIVVANEEFEIADGVTKIHIVNNAIAEWRRKNEGAFKFYIEEAQLNAGRLADTYKNWEDRLSTIVLTAIGDFKCRGMGPKEAREKCRRLPDASILKIAAEIYENYDRRLKMNGLLDFDDMLYNAKKMLAEDGHLLEKYRKKYTFVCEDEAQDSNLIQSEILTMISDGNLLRVGDSNQAICGSFSNSDFTLFKSFCELPQTTVYRITQSSRNTRQIIGLANHFVTYVREEHPVEECRESLLAQFIEPVDEADERKNPVVEGSGIRAHVFPSWEQEADGVLAEAAHRLKKDPDQTMAILIPTSWRIHDVVKRLEARNLPYEELDNTSREKNGTIRKLGRIIDFIAMPENGVKFSDMVLECFLTESYEEAEETGENTPVKKKGQKEKLEEFLKKYPVEDILYPAAGEIRTADIPEELSALKIWEDFMQRLDAIRALLEFPTTVLEKLILYISEMLNFDREERAIAQKVAGDVRYLMSQTPQWRLSDLALELLSPKNRFNFFANIVWELKGYEPKPGVVTVATYHKSKGLEWDIVFLTGLTYEDFPVGLKDKFKGEYWFLKPQYKNPLALLKDDLEQVTRGKAEGDSIHRAKLETIAERARLLYVGITRAKQYLYLSGFHSNPGKKNETQPSRYLLEIRRYMEEVGGQ